MTDPAAFARAVLGLRAAGLDPVVVHGGGPQIGAMLDRLGIASTFHQGLRVTSPEAMDVVRMVLVGSVGRDVVAALRPHGVGLSGEDAGLMTAVRHAPDGVDIGLVGDCASVDTSILEQLLAAGRIPVVATVAPDADGVPHNLNADTAAAAIAVALGADRLVMLTDVAGVYRAWPDPASLIDSLDADAVEELLPTLEAGMVPKMRACLTAVRCGVPTAHVVDGRDGRWAATAAGAAAYGTTIIPAVPPGSVRPAGGTAAVLEVAS
jgi:acetylglutamate kinase